MASSDSVKGPHSCHCLLPCLTAGILPGAYPYSSSSGSAWLSSISESASSSDYGSLLTALSDTVRTTWQHQVLGRCHHSLFRSCESCCLAGRPHNGAACFLYSSHGLFCRPPLACFPFSRCSSQTFSSLSQLLAPPLPLAPPPVFLASVVSLVALGHPVSI